MRGLAPFLMLLICVTGGYAGEGGEKFCNKTFGCHRTHEKEKTVCTKCNKSKIPSNDAFCSSCAAKAKACGHCGLPRPGKKKTNRKPKRLEGPQIRHAITEPTVRALILSSQIRTPIVCKGPVDITVPDAPRPLLSLNTLPATEVLHIPGGYDVGGKKIANRWLTIVCKNPDQAIKIADRFYVGQVHFVKKSNQDEKFLVVSETRMEQYLMGVVGPEIGADSPEESMKVQAIAARSYAFGSLPAPKATAKSRPIFDVFSDTKDQVYIGMPQSGKQRVEKVIKATYGMFLMYKGRVVRTYYHSACGGATIKSGDGSPPLSGVKCGWCKRAKYGHGWGLCQHGALAQGRAGKKFKEIIEFYFPKSEVIKRY